MKGLFEGYVRVFFVVGEKRDFVPSSSRSGPFVLVYEGIMKPVFLFGRYQRSKILRTIYNNTETLERPAEVVRIRTRDAAKPDSSRFRIEVYRYRRLPYLTRQASEMDPLIAWLQSAEKMGALKVSRDDALEICIAAIRNYRYLSDCEAAYIGYPLITTNAEDPSSGGQSTMAIVLRVMTQKRTAANENPRKESRGMVMMGLP